MILRGEGKFLNLVEENWKMVRVWGVGCGVWGVR